MGSLEFLNVLSNGPIAIKFILHSLGSIVFQCVQAHPFTISDFPLRFTLLLIVSTRLFAFLSCHLHSSALIRFYCVPLLSLPSITLHCVPSFSTTFHCLLWRTLCSIAFLAVPLHSNIFHCAPLRFFALHYVPLRSIVFTSLYCVPRLLLTHITFHCVPLRTISFPCDLLTFNVVLLSTMALRFLTFECVSQYPLTIHFVLCVPLCSPVVQRVS